MNKTNVKIMQRIKAELATDGKFTEDKYGNMVSLNKKVRYKFNELSYRKEMKGGSGWVRVSGLYYRNVRFLKRLYR